MKVGGSISRTNDMMQKTIKWFDLTDENVKYTWNGLFRYLSKS